MTLPQRVRVMFKSYVLRRLLLESTPVMFWSFHHDQEDYIVEVAQEMLRNYASENEVYDFLIEVEAITTEEKVVKIMDDIFNKQRPYWWGEVYNPKYRGNVFDMSWKHWKHLEHEELS